MSEVPRQAPATRTTGAPPHDGHGAPGLPDPWSGWVIFSSTMMILLGCFQGIAGLVALFNKSYYLVSSSGLVVHVDYTVWGWVHLIVGVVALVAGFGLFTGATWARVLAIMVAGLSAIVNFGFIPAFPLWALTIIVVDILVIYAVAAHGREIPARS
jgi:hypothetical protein